MVARGRGVGELACLCVLALALATAGCGPDSQDDGGADGATAVASATSFPDFLDPALSYSTLGWQMMWVVYTPLLTYAHAEGSAGSRLIPGFAAFFQDFPHPANFTTLVDGRAIQPTNSANQGNVDDAQITAILERAGTNADLGAVADDYAAVDRRIVEEAHVVPFGNRENTVLYSDESTPTAARSGIPCTTWTSRGSACADRRDRHHVLRLNVSVYFKQSSMLEE